MPTSPALYSLEHMGTQSPEIAQVSAPAGTSGNPQSDDKRRGTAPTGVSGDLTFFSRVARVQRQIESLQAVSDADLLQHAADLTQLMEQAWDCFIASGNHFAYDKALKHLRQRDAARRLLSQEWQERREAEILAGCSAGFFIDAGDKSRAQIAANEERGG